MNRCPSEHDLSALHDGEIASDEAADITGHLAECPACRASMEQLTRLSGLLDRYGREPLTAMSMARLHSNVEKSMQRGLLRLAWMLNGIAASVLIVGLVALNSASRPSTASAEAAAPPPWVAASVMSNSDPAVRTASSPAAQWYLADAADSSDEGQ